MTRRTTASAKRAAPSSPPNADPAVPLPARREGFRPVLTICCITFNHERYIAQALDGFLKQRTDFPVEIIVHDDCSTDRTASIVRDYQNRHPGLIRAVLRVENQYAQGKRIMPMFADWVDGEFVAVCEGDDFWTDPEKLQRQVDYLRTHPKAAGCFHDTSVVDDEGKVIADSYFDSQRISFSRHDVLATLLSREPTCSLVFRRTVFAPPLPAWYLRRPSDLYLDLLITEYGTFDFIRRNMGSYRRHASGVWSRESPSTQLVELIHRLMLLQEDRGFRERHAGVLQKKIGELRKSLFTREELKAEFARIERIAAEQAHYIEKLIEERDRAHLQIGATRAESSKAREDAARQQAAIKRELDQLAATSQEQTAYIKVLESERDRLASEADAARKQSRSAAKATAAELTAVRTQLDQLAVTAKEQTAYIESLVAERDRAAKQSADSEAQAHQARADSEQFLQSLRAQLDQLAATSQEQTAYIKVLESERDRLASEADAARKQSRSAAKAAAAELTALRAQLDQLATTSQEQTAYIESLVAERDRAAKQAADSNAQAQQARADSEQFLQSLRAQLDQLAVTSQEQTAYIKVLEGERARLAGERADVAQEAERLLKLVGEQTRYIEVLTERLSSRANGK